MSIFNTEEIYKIAILIEENGEKLYKNFSEKFTDPKIKEIFLFLANEESVHSSIFQKKLPNSTKNSEQFIEHEHYFDFFKSYASNIFFNFEKAKLEIKKIKTVQQALDFALKKEFESIAFYNEIKNLLVETDNNKINEIIKEEQKHVIILDKLKTKITGENIDYQQN